MDLALHSGMSRTRRSKIPEAAASIQIQDTNNDPVLLDLWQLRVVEGETVPRGDWSVEVGTFNFTKITREKKL